MRKVARKIALLGTTLLVACPAPSSVVRAPDDAGVPGLNEGAGGRRGGAGGEGGLAGLGGSGGGAGGGGGSSANGGAGGGSTSATRDAEGGGGSSVDAGSGPPADARGAAADVAPAGSVDRPPVAADRAITGDAPTSRQVVFVVSNLALGPGDQALKPLLEMHPLGPFTVTPVLDTAITPADATGKALVVISQGINASDVGDKLATVATPVLTMRPQSFDNLFMTGDLFNTDLGLSAMPLTEVSVTNAAHAMAGGKSGDVAVTMSAQLMTWGKPAASAEIVAVVKGNAAQAAIFGYPRGAAMATGQPAPARRVGWFATTAAAVVLTADGRALFQAAVTWALGR